MPYRVLRHLEDDVFFLFRGYFALSRFGLTNVNPRHRHLGVYAISKEISACLDMVSYGRVFDL